MWESARQGLTWRTSGLGWLGNEVKVLGGDVQKPTTQCELMRVCTGFDSVL